MSPFAQNLSDFFSPQNFMPHGHCYLWRPDMLALHVGSDALIAASYFSIPFSLIHIVRNRDDFDFNWIFFLFAAFIFACGMTHVFGMWVTWNPDYGAEGVMKFMTATVSGSTAVVLWRLTPRILSLPSQRDLKELNASLENRVKERSRALEEANVLLREREELLHATLSAGEIGTWEWNVAKESLTWNDIQERLYGYEPGERVHGEKAFVDRIHPADAPWVLDELQSALAHRTEFDVSFRIIIPAQGERWMHAKGRVFEDGAGVPLGMRGITHDVTRAKTTEDRLLRTEDELRKAVRVRDEFVATLSHELRNPMNVVLGWVTLMRTQQVAPDVQGRALEALERNARLQVQLISDLLDMSRIITGKLSLNPQSVDVVQIVEGCVDSVSLAARQKGVTVRTHVDVEKAIANADGERIHQVVWNLLANALKFTSAGGEVDVRVKKDPSEKILIVEVADTGQGIEPEFLPFVFDRFRQEDSSTTRGADGLGLGLAIVRHIMEMHGGFVRAFSEGKGKGATFQIALPMPEGPASSSGVPPGDVQKPGGHVETPGSAGAPVPPGRPESRVRPEEGAMPGTPGEPQTSRAAQGDVPASVVDAFFEKASRAVEGLKGAARGSFPGPSPSREEGSPYRVLVVDDLEDTRSLLRYVLEQDGARVEEASNAREALDLIGRASFDLVFCDIGMPVEDGFSFIAKLRERERTRTLPHLPVAALTAYARSEDIERAQGAGFDLHLAKPVVPSAVLRAVATLLAPRGR